MYFIYSAYNVPPMYIKTNVHLEAHFKVTLKCTFQTYCNVHLQLEYKCALNGTLSQLSTVICMYTYFLEWLVFYCWCNWNGWGVGMVRVRLVRVKIIY
jgi:hypothetical protein